MAGTVYVDANFRLPSGQVLSVGRVLIGGNDIINPEDMRLNNIKGVLFQPWQAPPQPFLAGRRQFRSMQGSIGSLGDLTGNYIRVTTVVVKGTGFVAAGYPGTLYIGTSPGSIRASYIAWGE